MDDKLIEEYSSQDPIMPIINEEVFGQDYRLNALPRYEEGNLKFNPAGKGNYHIYLEWLSDYFFVFYDEYVHK